MSIHGRQVNRTIVENEREESPPSPRREELTGAIANEEAHLARLDAEQVAARERLERLRAELTTSFVSKKTGRPGYAPACSNKFVKGVCELPRVKCGDCTNQAFSPFDDAAVVANLTGRHVMGIYPLLDDETCWFLAVDFDKSSWEADVRAFVETCRRAGLPAAVERSRSGNGAHVWSSSRRLYRPRARGRWVASSSPRRCRGDTS